MSSDIDIACEAVRASSRGLVFAVTENHGQANLPIPGRSASLRRRPSVFTTHAVIDELQQELMCKLLSFPRRSPAVNELSEM